VPGPLACPRPSEKGGKIWRSDRAPWTLLPSRSCAPTSYSAGMLSAKILTFALGPVRLRKRGTTARTRTDLLGLPAALLGHFWISYFLCVARTESWVSERAATSCPGTQDFGFVFPDRVDLVQCAGRVF
jgi:hypothetical protein